MMSLELSKRNIVHVPDINTLKVGNHVLIGNRPSVFGSKLDDRNTLVGEVLSIEGDRVDIEVDDLGVLEGTSDRYILRSDANDRFNFLPLRGICGLKTKDRTVIKNYMTRVYNSHSLSVTIFHVQSVGDGIVYGKIVGQEGDTKDEGELLISRDRNLQGDLQPIFSVQDGVFASLTLPARIYEDQQGQKVDEIMNELSAGDLIICSDYGMDYIDGKLSLRLNEASIMGNFKTTERAVDFLNFDNDNFYLIDRLASSCGVLEEQRCALARTEPDKALVLIYGDDAYKSAYVLGSSGIHAYINPELSDYLEQETGDSGLWVIDDLKNRSSQSYEGEWDAWVEGDWRPAKKEDVTELFGDYSELDSELCDVLDIDFEDGITERQIALSVVSSFEDKYRIKAKSDALEMFGIKHPEYFYVNNTDNKRNVDEFICGYISDIKFDDVKELYLSKIRDHIFKTPSQFIQFPAPRPPAKTSFGSKLMFSPTGDLHEKMKSIGDICVSKQDQISDRLNENKRAFHGMNIEDIFVNSRFCLDEMRLFSDAQKTGVKWFYNPNECGDRAISKLYLCDEGVHIASIVRKEDKWYLETPLGFEISSVSNRCLPGERKFSINHIALDADRAVCELNARDVCRQGYNNQLQDGVYNLSDYIVHIEDGLIHRSDGPAIERNGESVRWFRGKLERAEDRDGNQEFFDATKVLEKFEASRNMEIRSCETRVI